MSLNFVRFEANPIIQPDMDDRMGDNINGPSLIRVPDWVENPLGKYYLYFAHHQGTYIRMAYADALVGPWQIYSPGVLDLADSYFDDHIASPDVHIIEESHEIRMYYHGCYSHDDDNQLTHVATSDNGLNFTAMPHAIGHSYWRAFRWNGYWYTLEMPGVFRRSKEGISDFELGPTLFTQNMRHAAVSCQNNNLTVFYSNAHDCPEQIVWAEIRLEADWKNWSVGVPKTLLSPEEDWEGVKCPIEPSERGSVHHRVHQLRDPCVFEDEGRTYLLYSVAGEYGIAIGELIGSEATDSV